MREVIESMVQAVSESMSARRLRRATTAQPPEPPRRRRHPRRATYIPVGVMARATYRPRLVPGLR